MTIDDDIPSLRDDFPHPLQQDIRSPEVYRRLCALMHARGFDLRQAGEIWALHYTPRDFDNAILPRQHFTPVITDNQLELDRATGYQIEARHVHVIRVVAADAQYYRGNFRAEYSRQRAVWDVRSLKQEIIPSDYVKLKVGELHVGR